MADGRLLFETKIDTSGIKKGLSEIRSEMTKLMDKQAYDNLKAAMEASEKEVLNFRAAISETFDDGVFKVSRLTDEQKIFYRDLQQGAANIRKQWESVNSTFSITTKIVQRLREFFLTLTSGAIIGAITFLGLKLFELSKEMAGVESSSEKLNRLLREESRKSFKESTENIEAYRKQLELVKEAQKQVDEYMKTRTSGERFADTFGSSDRLKNISNSLYDMNKEYMKSLGLTRNMWASIVESEDRMQEAIDATEKALKAASDNQSSIIDKNTRAFDDLNMTLKEAESELYMLAAAGQTSGEAWNEASNKYKVAADELERIKNAVIGVTEATANSAIVPKQVESWSKSFTDGLMGVEYQSSGMLGGLIFGVDGNGENLVQQLGDIDNALQSNYDKQAELQGKKDEASRVALAGLRNEEEALIRQKETVRGYFDSYVAGIQQVGDAWSAFGAAVANGENPLSAFASSLKDSVADIIDLYAQQTMALAIVNSLTPGGKSLSAEAFVQYFVLKALAGFVRAAHFAQGGVVGGTKAQGDNIPIMASAGEIVLNAAQQRNVADAMNPNVNVIINNNSPDTEVSAQEDENGNIMVFIEQKVLETMSSPKGQRIIKSAGRGI